jgi:cell division protein FtsI (penicillin-binding protein 3)
MAIRDEIVLRSGIVYFIIVLCALAILGNIIILQIVQRGKWSELGEKYVYKTAEMPADRGDILSMDGRLLASSVPYYTLYMDTRSSGMSDNTWINGIDGLSAGLSRLAGVRSAAAWKSVLTQARKRGDRYFLVKRRRKLDNNK